MGSQVRRVVTGTRDGRSLVDRDEVLDPVTVSPLPGYAWHRLWSLDQLSADPGGTRSGVAGDHFPPPGGVRFNLYTVPPAREGPPAALTAQDHRELEAALPGRARYLNADQRGMHRTPSLDLLCVLSGEIWLELDDDQIHLRAGDCVVQNGTMHAWRNRGDVPCTMAIVMLGVATSGAPG